MKLPSCTQVAGACTELCRHLQ